VPNIDYQAVIADLEHRVGPMLRAIETLKELAGKAIPDEPLPKNKYTKRKLTKKAVQQVNGTASKPESIRDCIRRVVTSGPMTAIEITDKVVKLRPDAVRNNVSTAICQMIAEQKLRKDESLKVYHA
jgi:hypothetical protein